MTRNLVAGVCAVVVVGCADDGGETTPRTVDAEAVRVAALAYKDGGFTRVTASARESQHAGDMVHIWVADAAVDAYLAVTPDATTADPDFPEGTMIVKEQLGADGTALSALTVMVKGPDGSGAASDDWYWARIEPNGSVTVQGEVGLCIGCHTPRRAVDWVFGVAADNRVSR